MNFKTFQKQIKQISGQVHDDVSKLRKVQKTMEMKKKKGQVRTVEGFNV